MACLGWCHLGRVSYAAARRLQERLAAERRRGFSLDVLLTLEHPPVVTLGRHWREPAAQCPDSVAAGPSPALERVRADRGGGPTYHGPGQLVAYPVVALGSAGRGVRGFVAALEASLCDVAGRFGVPASTLPDHPGAWVRRDGRLLQVGSVGLAVRRGVTLHGAALNVERRAEAGFAGFTPCGVAGVAATSFESELGRPAPGLLEVAAELAAALARRSGYGAGHRRVEPCELPAASIEVASPAAIGAAGATGTPWT